MIVFVNFTQVTCVHFNILGDRGNIRVSHCFGSLIKTCSISKNYEKRIRGQVFVNLKNFSPCCVPTGTPIFIHLYTPRSHVGLTCFIPTGLNGGHKNHGKAMKGASQDVNPTGHNEKMLMVQP